MSLIVRSPDFFSSSRDVLWSKCLLASIALSFSLSWLSYSTRCCFLISLGLLHFHIGISSRFDSPRPLEDGHGSLTAINIGCLEERKLWVSFVPCPKFALIRANMIYGDVIAIVSDEVVRLVMVAVLIEF